MLIDDLIWLFHCLHGYFGFADVKKVSEKTSKTIKMPNEIISRQKQKRYITDNEFCEKKKLRTRISFTYCTTLVL